MMHDAISHWVNELNTVFIRANADDGEVSKVPFSMKRVAGSFTEDALWKQMITEISGIKALKDNATAWKVPYYRVFSSPYFPAFGLNTERYLSVFSLNAGKDRPEQTPYLDTSVQAILQQRNSNWSWERISKPP